jgi:hypothetical protein
MLSGLDGFEGEQGIKVEQLERFPSVDWSKCASPPMTPGKFSLLHLGLPSPTAYIPRGTLAYNSRREQEQAAIRSFTSAWVSLDSIDCRVSIVAIRMYELL